MKKLMVMLAVLAILACQAIDAKKIVKGRRMKPKAKPTEAVLLQDADVPATGSNEVVDDDIVKILDRDEEYARQQDLQRENERAREESVVDPETFNMVQLPDVCANVHCGAGRICRPNDANIAECVCITDCPVETEARRKVCTNHNETWSSDCAVYQHRCWCDAGDARCGGAHLHHVHVDYYGECRAMPACGDGEMADFPRRMRDWLFNIMRDLADRDELPAFYRQMEEEAAANMTKRWANAAVWKWCDLDGHPHDRSVSLHELFPIRAPLMSLEHCIAPFLSSCDEDGNHRITLKEWARCLQIDEDDIDERCERIENPIEDDNE